MRLTVLRAAVAATLALGPSVTMAQSATDSDSATGAVKMKGPPNANGMSSGPTTQPDQPASGRSESSGSMKGPPNADGAPGARGPNN